MSLPRATLLLVAACTTIGCDSAPTSPGRQPGPGVARLLGSASEVALNDLPGDKQSVTGHYQLVGSTTLNDFKYSFSAIRHEDGSVSGEIEERTVFNPTGAFVRTMHGTVSCFTIIPATNMAFVAGIVDKVESLAPNQENLIPGAF